MKKCIAMFAATVLAATATAAGAQTAATAGPDAVRLDLARQLYAASGGEKQVETAIDTMSDVMSKTFVKTLPGAQADVVRTAMDGAMQDTRAEIIRMIPAMMEAGAQVYARNLSEAELRDYLAWLRSDSGRAIIAKVPLIRRQVLEVVMPMMAGIAPQITRKVEDRICGELHCTTEQRQAAIVAVGKAFGGGGAS